MPTHSLRCSQTTRRAAVPPKLNYAAYGVFPNMLRLGILVQYGFLYIFFYSDDEERVLITCSDSCASSFHSHVGRMRVRSKLIVPRLRIASKRARENNTGAAATVDSSRRCQIAVPRVPPQPDDDRVVGPPGVNTIFFVFIIQNC